MTSPARGGAWLIAASLLFWVSWLLMPGVGVTDAARILSLVAESRRSVQLSVVLQLVSAAAYAPGLASVLGSAVARESRLVRLGAVVLLIGAMGSAADAVFHLVAFEMTAPGLAGPALEVVMRRLQGPGLALLLPFVAAFFAGHVLLVLGLRRRGLVGALAPWLLAAAPLAAGIGALVARAGGAGARVAGLAVLGCVSGSLVVSGARLWSMDRA